MGAGAVLAWRRAVDVCPPAKASQEGPRVSVLLIASLRMAVWCGREMVADPLLRLVLLLFGFPYPLRSRCHPLPHYLLRLFSLRQSILVHRWGPRVQNGKRVK